LLYNFCPKDVIIRTERLQSKAYIDLHVKYLLRLSDFNENRIFSTYFRKSNQASNFMKILSVGAELIYEDGRTETHVMKLIGAYRNFAHGSKNRMKNATL